MCLFGNLLGNPRFGYGGYNPNGYNTNGYNTNGYNDGGFNNIGIKMALFVFFS